MIGFEESDIKSKINSQEKFWNFKEYDLQGQRRNIYSKY